MNIVVDGYNICYKTTGTGDKTVVILQGWGTDLGVYDSVAGVIDGSRYRVIQFDFPGFGGSDEPKEPWDVDGFADFFCRFMEVMQVKQATLIGHSYGGRVIIKLAARESIPFEITNIILIDSAGVLPVRTTAQKWKIRKYKILKKFLNMKLIYAMFPEVIDDWRSRQGSADYRNATPMMRQCMVKAVNEDLTELLPVEQTEIRAQIEFYKAHRRTLQYGRFTRGKTDGGGIIWQAKTKEETVAGVFHGVQHAAPGYERLRVTGLDEKKQYRLDSRPQLLRVGDFGSLLRHVLPVKLNPNGLAVQTADSYYKMYDSQQTVTASGAAYSAGIMLAPRFAGTGYDADGRMQGDFGSNVYFIREVQS